MALCFECRRKASYYHHVVPVVMGGTRTVPLCSECHPKAHGRNGHWNTSELTKAALAKKRAKGNFCGGSVKYGWTSVNGALVPVGHELSMRQLITVWHRGGLSLWAICRALDTMGIRTKTGRECWQEATIRKICKGL